MYRRLADAERELVKLRYIAGHLKVEDESKIHAIALETYDQWAWKWRVYLPKGKKYVWKMDVGDIPIEGVPKSYAGSCWEFDPGSVPSEKSVEYVVTVAVRKDIENKWVMPLSVGGSKLIASIPDECMEKMKSNGGYTECLNGGNAIDLSTNRPIILLKKYATPTSTSEKDPSNRIRTGIIVWLEEAPKDTPEIRENLIKSKSY